MQLALKIAEPWGDDRADMRSEANTLAAINPCEDTILRLTTYHKNENRKQIASPEQMRQHAEMGG